MRVRNAILPDAEAVERLIAVHTGDGTLLPRTLAEICENIRDFVVVEHHGHIIGCGALHLYGVHLAEIRSITVKPARQLNFTRTPFPTATLMTRIWRHRTTPTVRPGTS